MDDWRAARMKVGHRAGGIVYVLGKILAYLGRLVLTESTYFL